MLDVPSWKKVILEYRQHNNGKNPDYPYLSRVFNKPNIDLMIFAKDSGIGPQSTIDEPLEDLEGEEQDNEEGVVCATSNEEGKCLTSLDLPLSEKDVDDISSLRKGVSPELAELIAKALGVTVGELTEKPVMDRQANQAIADFVEEMEEIYPDLADTELQAVVSAAVRDLRERKADQEPFENLP